MPTIRAKAKSCSVSPPKKNSARIGSSVASEVLSERVAVSHKEMLTI